MQGHIHDDVLESSLLEIFDAEVRLLVAPAAVWNLFRSTLVSRLDQLLQLRPVCARLLSSWLRHECAAVQMSHTPSSPFINFTCQDRVLGLAHHRHKTVDGLRAVTHMQDIAGSFQCSALDARRGKISMSV